MVAANILPPHLGNPGSATVHIIYYHAKHFLSFRIKLDIHKMFCTKIIMFFSTILHILQMKNILEYDLYDVIMICNAVCVCVFGNSWGDSRFITLCLWLIKLFFSKSEIVYFVICTKNIEITVNAVRKKSIKKLLYL